MRGRGLEKMKVAGHFHQGGQTLYLELEGQESIILEILKFLKDHQWESLP